MMSKIRRLIKKYGAGYQYTVNLDHHEHGVRHVNSKGGFKTKKECKKAIKILIADIEKGEYFEESDILLEIWLNQWPASLKPTVKFNTYKIYEVNIRKHIIPKLANVNHNKLTPLQIQNL